MPKNCEIHIKWTKDGDGNLICRGGVEFCGARMISKRERENLSHEMLEFVTKSIERELKNSIKLDIVSYC